MTESFTKSLSINRKTSIYNDTPYDKFSEESH